jgi:small subunit ribosomal protein S7
MRKRSSYKKNVLQGDFLHRRVDISRFINYLMSDGRKATAERVFYACLKEIETMTKEDAVSIFDKALQNAAPLVQVVSKRVGGANYQVPREVRPERKFFLASHWIIDAAKKRKGAPMAKKLAEELIAASKNEGAAIKKKQDTHRMAEANRAFASFVR